jgi:hypothetical protein
MPPVCQSCASTERPAVKGYSFTTWRSPGTPVVRLVFNQPVTQGGRRVYTESVRGKNGNPDLVATGYPIRAG